MAGEGKLDNPASKLSFWRVCLESVSLCECVQGVGPSLTRSLQLALRTT